MKEGVNIISRLLVEQLEVVFLDRLLLPLLVREIVESLLSKSTVHHFYQVPTPSCELSCETLLILRRMLQTLHSEDEGKLEHSHD